MRVPYTDDPSLNFAFFVYNGVPDYVASTRSVHPDGAGYVHPSAVLTSLPVYHLVTGGTEYQQCYAYFGEQIPKSNSASRSAFHWHGTFVYDGVVYDHIKYRLRQANDRYSNYTKLKGKRSMRFRFNRGNISKGGISMETNFRSRYAQSTLVKCRITKESVILV